MLIINKEYQKINQILLMNVLLVHQYINDIVYVQNLKDIDEFHKFIFIQDKQLLNDIYYHLIYHVDLSNNYLLIKLNDKTIEELIPINKKYW